MKKQSTIILLAAAAAAAYFFMRKKTDDTVKQIDEGEPVEIKPDAEVTAPKGKFFEALEKAQQVATTIKDAAVVVTDGNKKAVVTTGLKKIKKRKKVKCPKKTAAELKLICQGLKGKELRQCKRKNRRSCITIQPTQSATFSETGTYQ
jgi:hypothetical protein